METNREEKEQLQLEDIGSLIELEFEKALSKKLHKRNLPSYEQLVNRKLL